VNRWDAFTAVCSYLRAGLLKNTPFHRVNDQSLELLIEASSHHYVTPALAWCLKDQTEIPSEIREYLDAVLALNARRNEGLLAGLARIVAALNAIDIEPVLLKGAARLIEASYPAPKLRFLGDLDVLIPAERSASAVVALQSIGFRMNADHETLPSSCHHHLPMLYERETGVGVELHTDVVGDAGAVIPTGWFWKGTNPVPFRDLQIRLPDATRSAGHNIAHDQLDHSNYQGRRVELRQLLDLAMIRRARESAIDWAELDERFCRMGFGEALATYLKFAEVLLGQPAPQLRHAPCAGTITYFSHIIEPPPAWMQPATILIDEIARRRRDPRSMIHLLNLKTWPHLCVRVTEALKRRWSGSW
jgi:hypothetical protein